MRYLLVLLNYRHFFLQDFLSTPFFLFHGLIESRTHKPGSVHASVEGGGYLSGTAADGLERRVYSERCQWPAAVPWPCSSRGLPSQHSMLLVRSTAPLHPCLCQRTGHRRCFLWHCPHVTCTGRYPASLPSGSPDFPQPILKEIGRNYLASYPIMPCGHNSWPGAVAQLDRATAS